MKKILITGTTGFLGTALVNYFMGKGIEVVSLSRKPAKTQADHHILSANHTITWRDLDTESALLMLEDCDAWINLAGKSVDCRYNEANKKAILNSRIITTRKLNNVLNKLSKKPAVFLNASTATIYEHSENRANTETNGIIGDDFSMNVAQSWEREFFSFHTPETRKIAMRTSIVLGNEGGAFPKLKQITSLGLGGKQGSGSQMVSWIHIADFCRAVEFLIHSKLVGVINVTAPHPLRNEEFTRTLAAKMHKVIAIPQPVWLLKLGAAIIGTETELLLKSRYVLPQRLQKAGFKWQFAHAGDGMQNLLD